jgi:hypothetical protein
MPPAGFEQAIPASGRPKVEVEFSKNNYWKRKQPVPKSKLPVLLINPLKIKRTLHYKDSVPT